MDSNELEGVKQNENKERLSAMKKLMLAFAAIAAVLGAKAEAEAPAGGRFVSAEKIYFKDGHLAADLSFTTGDNDCTLVVCMGALDGGDSIGGWEKYVVAGAVAGGVDSMTWMMPEAYNADIHSSLRYFRFFLLDRPAGYVALESIQSTGTQYIILKDYIPTGSTKVQAEVQQLAETTTSFFWGSRKAYNSNRFGLSHLSGTGTAKGFRCDYGKGTTQYMVPDLDLSERGVVTMDGTGVTLNGRQMRITNDKGGETSMSVESYDCTGPLRVFSCNDNTADGSKGAGNLCAMRFYSFKVWSDYQDDSSVVFDLVPRQVNGVIGLWDRKSQQFFGSAVQGENFISDMKEVLDVDAEVFGSTQTLASPARLLSVTDFYRTTRHVVAELAMTAGDADCSLVVCYGSVDGGSEIKNWEHSKVLGAVGACETAKACKFDVESASEYSYWRFFLAARPCSVYESIESTGTQYIILNGYTPTGNTKVQAEVQQLEETATSYFWGSRKGYNTDRFGLAHLSGTGSGKGFRYDYGNDSTSLYLPDLDLSNRAVVTMDGTGVTLNGETVRVTYSGGTEVKPTVKSLSLPGPMRVFSCNDNTADGSKGAGNLCAMRFYSFKVWSNYQDDTSLVFDLVPCKDAEGAGFLNLKDGAVFHNCAADGDDFVLGGDECVNPRAQVYSNTASLPPPPLKNRGLIIVVQ